MGVSRELPGPLIVPIDASGTLGKGCVRECEGLKEGLWCEERVSDSFFFPWALWRLNGKKRKGLVGR